MKTKNDWLSSSKISYGFIIATMVVFNSVTVQAQKRDSTRMAHHWHEKAQHEKGGLYGIPNLTEDQKAKIKALKTPLAKEILPLRNQLAEKRVHLRTLQTAEKADMAAINTTIDEIAQAEAQLGKKKAAHTQAIRKILNDDQRIAFDMRRGSEHKRSHSLEKRSKQFHGRNE